MEAAINELKDFSDYSIIKEALSRVERHLAWSGVNSKEFQQKLENLKTALQTVKVHL